MKDCPPDMELNCTMYQDVYFDYVGEFNIIHCYIQHETHKTSITFNQHGTPNSDIKAKCVIFPKGKTTWEGFHRPFKDGDILYIVAVFDWVCIYKEDKDTENFYKYVAISPSSKSTNIVYDEASLCCKKDDILEMRLATEEEKQKLFDAIKANGYRWNSETKTLEKLVKPIFRVWDTIRNKNDKTIHTINYIYYDSYALCDGHILYFKEQDQYELVPNKFDITTLVPFESRVLVREDKTDVWRPTFYGFFHQHSKRFYTTSCGTWLMCIPYNEKTMHLTGTTNDCNDFYKTWKE